MSPFAISQNAQQVDVLFVNMPFGLLTQPSIGLSLLQAQIRTAGISNKILYFTLQFAQSTGVQLYNRIATSEPAMVDLLGEWLFSSALFSDEVHPTDDYIDRVLLGGDSAHRPTNPAKEKAVSEEFLRDVLDIRAKIPAFLDACIQQVLQYHPKIVGFTSLFQQHVASLALAQRLRSADPGIKILFGGANCEGVMGVETVRQFRFVDVAVSGEADLIINELIRRLLVGQDVDDIQGVYTQDNVDIPCINGIYLNAPVVKLMDDLPYPDYSDYFQQKEELGLDFSANVLFETSRGCWWGQKHHCTFCGLNDLTIAFRSKSADRALSELLCLRDAYPGCAVILVDNILDMKYFRSFVPYLANLDLDLKLFYEVKANLKKDQLRLLQSAGITTIQPGIESFSTRTLDLMNKGVKALQNIQLLKWCKELGIVPIWNFLWGFPGEDPQEYQRMAQLIPLLMHLPPPLFAQEIHIDRFSPHFERAEQYGFSNVRPYPSASYVYPALSDKSIFNLVYYFTSDYTLHPTVRSQVAECAQRIEEWKRVYGTIDLDALVIDDELFIWDFRPISQHIVTRLVGLEQEIYLLCDAFQSLDTLRTLIARYLGPVSGEEAQAMLQQFVDRNLMVVERGSYLSLAALLPDAASKRPALETMLRAMEVAGTAPVAFRITQDCTVGIGT
jgi:ribosomal peptide maturation radical SAM protein 1